MRKKVVFIIVILVIIIGLAGFAYVTAKTEMGPKDIKIKKWRFHLSMDIFKIDNPGQGIIRVAKKNQDKEIQGGFILFNKRVLGLKAFLTGKDRTLQKKVELGSTNIMIVFLRGIPGASVRVDMKRGVNTKPVAKNDKASTSMNKAVGINVLANDKDVDRDTLTVAHFTKPLHGKIEQSGGGILTYTPQPGFRGKDTFTYTIMDGKGGMDTADVNVAVFSKVALEITSPSDGKKITRPDIMVRGTVSNPAGNEVEIKVNGVAAIVYENQFVVNHVPLESGKNTIAATVTDIDGNTATASVVVDADPSGKYIKILADTETSIAPLETALRVEGTIALTEPFLTYTGPAKAEFLETTSDKEYGVMITTAGAYFFTAEVIDTKNNANYTDTIAIVVLHNAKKR